MIFNKDTANAISESLLRVKANKLNNGNPFTWASGMRSPIYCDNRVTLSYPKVRTYIRQQFVKAIQDSFSNIDVVAGVATGAIAQGALVAQELGLPFVYVRSESKKHGLENLIEGRVESGQSVVVVEDLVSTGKSSLQAVEALRKAGCKVVGMVAIFSYQLPVATENFKKEKCKLVTLADYDTMIAHAAENGYVKEADLASLKEWRKDPAAWAEKFNT